MLGVNDFSKGDHVTAAIASARAKLPPSAAGQLATTARASLLLAHQPRSANSAAENGIGGVLSGHTHGGQVWPVHWSTYVGNNGWVAGGFEVSRGASGSEQKLQLYLLCLVDM